MHYDLNFLLKLNGLLTNLFSNHLHHTFSTPTGKFVVAGGAIRDMLGGKAIKDIDVFFLSNKTCEYPPGIEDVLPPEVAGLFQKAPLEDYGASEFITYNLKPMAVGTAMGNLQLSLEFPIQLMCTTKTNVSDLIDDFPINLSRVTFSISDGLTIPFESLHGFAEKVLVGDNPDWLDAEHVKQKQVAYVNKIKEKYYDYKHIMV